MKAFNRVLVQPFLVSSWGESLQMLISNMPVMFLSAVHYFSLLAAYYIIIEGTLWHLSASLDCRLFCTSPVLKTNSVQECVHV